MSSFQLWNRSCWDTAESAYNNIVVCFMLPGTEGVMYLPEHSRGQSLVWKEKTDNLQVKKWRIITSDNNLIIKLGLQHHVGQHFTNI